MKRIIIVLVVSLSSLFGSEVVDFDQLVEMASKDVDTNIYLDNSLKDSYEVQLNLSKNPKEGEIFAYFTDILDENNLTLRYNQKFRFYTVVNKKKKREPQFFPEVDPKTKIHFYTYKIKNVTNKDVASALSVMPGIVYKYLPQSDMIAYSATQEQHRFVLESLRNTDNKSLQRSIKITIFATTKGKVKEAGTYIEKAGISFDTSVFFGNVSDISSAINNIAQFKANMKFMEDNDYIEIFQAPTMLLTNGIEAKFNSVKTVPYLETTSTISDAKTSSTESYNYKDVGLQINVLPKIKKDKIFIDLNLTSEEVLDLNDNRPITQKLTYTNSVVVTKRSPVLLTGFKKTIKSTAGSKIPLLGDIPLFGLLFNFERKKKETVVINILIEVV